MSDLALIAALQNAGVDVSAKDESAVILDRLQARVIRVVTSPPETFDRGLFDHLMELWTTLQPATEGPADAD